MELAIADIKIGKRHRKQMGNIGGLAKSIDRLGQLQAIVVTPAHELVAGLRRIRAMEKLKRTTIRADVAKTAGDAARLIEAERDENTERKNYTVPEGLAIGRAIEELYRPVAEEAQKEGRKAGASKGGKTAGRGRPIASGKNKPQGKRDEAVHESRRTTSQAAKAAGMSRTTYEKGKVVMESGDQAAIQEMEETGKVDPAYQKVRGEKPKAKSASSSTAKPDVPQGSDGRPKNIKPFTEAMQIATFVISHLGRIRDDDPKRDTAFAKVQTWIEKRRTRV